MDRDIPIIGQRGPIELGELDHHIAALDGMINTHKMAIKVLNHQLDKHYHEEEKPNAIYMELVNVQISTHCAAVSQMAGNFALLAAMGVPGVPVPEQITYDDGEPIQ